MNSEFKNHLSENDYLSILTIIKQLGDCRSRFDLNNLLEHELLRILDSSSCVYVFVDPDFAHVNVLDAVNIPKQMFAMMQAVIEIDSLGHSIVNHNRAVMAYDVDLDRQVLKASCNTVLQQHPEYIAGAQSYVENLNTAMGTMNLPDATVGMGIHRLKPNNKLYTAREIRILEFIQPTLLQTIRSIVLTEELNRYRSFSDSLADVSSPVTLLDKHLQVLFRNQAFEQLFPCATDRLTLPDTLLALLHDETSRLRSMNIEYSSLDIPFYFLDHDLFRLNLSSIYVESNGEKLWLLRMIKVIDPYSELLHRLQEDNLTSREIEICLYLRDGFETRALAERLFISYHTVRNHLSNIYQKIDVNSKAKLVAYLNK